MECTTPFCAAVQTWQDGMERYPPSASQQWNTIPLKPEDLEDDFYRMIVVLETRHQLHEFSDQDFDQLQITFSLVTASGQQYNLIPNGSEIRVTKSNAYEYFQRIHYHYESLRHSATVSQRQSEAQQVRLRSTTTGLRLTERDEPAIDEVCRNASNDPEKLVCFPGDKLRWAVVPRNTDFMIRLRPHGETIDVEPDEVYVFIREVLITMHEIRRAIEIFGYYPPNVVSPVPADLMERAVATTAIHPVAPAPQQMSPPPVAQPRRISTNGRSALYASARAAAAAAAATIMSDRGRLPSASPAELAHQRALLSPTHDTGNILAPFQIMNL